MLSIAGSRAAAWAATFASPGLLPILLLVGSNLFMTFAWYGHLRFKEVPLAGVIVASWLIAFFEYCMGAGEPLGQRGLYPRPTQDHPGGDHASRVRRLLGALSQGAHELELCHRLRLDR